VQWHPEEAMDQRPFDALLNAARDSLKERSVRTTV
jgi:gamma-glutamyl-gamma-aminobutyrate hydrolase PuuD